MELGLTGEQRVLLDDKNVLSHETLEKYRQAGQIAQTGLVYVQSLLKDRENLRTIGEICRLGDQFLQRATDTAFKRSVKERGIALPVQIDKKHFFSSVAPEEGDVFQGGELMPGELVKVSLGIHIDGYTAQACHTLVIPDAEETMGEQALEGPEADAICAAYLASEAVLAKLGLALSSNHPAGGSQNVTGSVLKSIVESIAQSFRVQIAPGSRIRRVRRFLAGQSLAIQESDFKGIEWSQEYLEQQVLGTALDHQFEEFAVLPGEVWLVDMRMAATENRKGILRAKEFTGYGSTVAKPTIYCRDYSIQYNLKMSAARTLLSKVSNTMSVYPFKLSYVSSNQNEFNFARLGLGEAVQHHIFVPHVPEILEFVPIEILTRSANPGRDAKRAAQPVSVAREMSTLILVPGAQSGSGFPEAIRLTGGNKSAAPSWVHSVHQITDPSINELLQIRKDKNLHGVSFQDVQPSRDGMARPHKQSVDEVMEVDN